MAKKPETKPSDLINDYEVTVAREIASVPRRVGDIVKMTAPQARYYLSPMGTGLKLSKPAGADKKEAVPASGAAGQKPAKAS